MRIILLLTSILVLQACNDTGDNQQSVAHEVFTPGDSLAVTGTLVDTRCFGEDTSNIGNDHMRPEGHVEGCGSACARMGFPVAVVQDGEQDGKVWVLLTPPQAMADYISATVRVVGTIRDEGILIPERIELNTPDGWAIIL